MINKKLILYALMFAIVAVILRYFYDINACIESGGEWNSKTRICMAKLKPVVK